MFSQIRISFTKFLYSEEFCIRLKTIFVYIKVLWISSTIIFSLKGFLQKKLDVFYFNIIIIIRIKLLEYHKDTYSCALRAKNISQYTIYEANSIVKKHEQKIESFVQQTERQKNIQREFNVALKKNVWSPVA